MLMSTLEGRTPATRSSGSLLFYWLLQIPTEDRQGRDVPPTFCQGMRTI
jgi:hypothetical protein